MRLEEKKVIEQMNIAEAGTSRNDGMIWIKGIDKSMADNKWREILLSTILSLKHFKFKMKSNESLFRSFLSAPRLFPS